MIAQASGLKTSIQPLWQWLWRHEGRLKDQVFRGGIWLCIGNGLTHIAGLIRLAILARLLTPTDFGVIGIAMLLIRWFEQFSQTGFNQALIRTQDDIQPYLNTLWTVQVLRGAVLSTALLCAAPAAAWFFDHPDARAVIQALAPLVFLRSLINPATVYLKRELDFRRIVMWNMCQVLSGLLVAIPLALIYRNVWALVLSLLVGQAVHMLTSYRLHAFRPRFAFNYKQAREMANFGKWIFWKNLLNALRGSLDSLTIGRLLGASALGLYQVAYRVATFPSHVMIGVLPHVTFPAYAKLQERAQLRHAYLQVLEHTLLVTLPIATLLYIFPQPLVRVFLGEQWMQVVPLIQLLAVLGGLRTLLDVALPMFEGVGRPDLHVKFQLIEIGLSVPVIYALTRTGGLQGAALAVVCVNLLLVGIQYGMLHGLLGLRITEGIRSMRLGIAAVTPLLGFGVLRLFYSFSSGVLVGLGSLSVVACLVVIWRVLRPQLKLVHSMGACQ
jgi:O-antigen/teichoic acid export membrane protein